MKTGEEVRGTSDGGAHGREVRKAEPQPGCGRGLSQGRGSKGRMDRAKARTVWEGQLQELKGLSCSPLDSWCLRCYLAQLMATHAC